VVAAAHEQQHLAVRRQGEVGDLLAVVLSELRHLPRLEPGPVGHPDVAHALDVAHPGDPVRAPGADQLIDEREGGRLFQGEPLGAGRARRQHHSQGRAAQRLRQSHEPSSRNPMLRLWDHQRCGCNPALDD
jgi:hypothetical protein